jgi:hypothetical protein
MYKLTLGNVIKRLSDGACIPNDPANSDYAAFLKWQAEGNTPEPYVPPAPSLDDYKNAIQSHLDAKAREMGYDSIFTAVGYRGDPNLEWSDEANRLFLWRSRVWGRGVEIQTAVATGLRAAPTVAQLLAELPAFV